MHVRVGFLYFVEQHHGIRATANGFSQHAAFTISNISRGRAFERADGVRFLEFGHINFDEVLLAAVKRLRDGERGFGFARAGGPDQHKDAHRPIGIIETRPARANPLGNHFQSVPLPDDALLKHIRKVQHLLDFVFRHAPDRNPGPVRHD